MKIALYFTSPSGNVSCYYYISRARTKVRIGGRAVAKVFVNRKSAEKCVESLKDVYGTKDVDIRIV